VKWLDFIKMNYFTATPINFSLSGQGRGVKLSINNAINCDFPHQQSRRDL
jgi:hypothetical protein